MLAQKFLAKTPSRLFLSVCLVLSGIVISSVVIAEGTDGESSGSEKGNGLGTKYDWKSLEEGKKIAQEEKKPLMIIIHKSWCGACKSLKPKFAKSKSIGKLSKFFVMVQTMDEDEPKGDIYTPDGGYIPRILYFDPEGTLLDVINEGGNPDYKYYYPDTKSIAKSMKAVLSKLSIDYEEKAEEKTKEEKESEPKSESESERTEL